MLKINEDTKKWYKIRDDIFVEGDSIFGMIYATDNFRNIRYIEEILSERFESHYTVYVKEERLIHKIEKGIEYLEDIEEPYFTSRDYEHNKQEISYFFILLMMKYQQYVLKDKPLIYIVEDCQELDNLSIEFINQIVTQIRNVKIENIFLLCTFQTSICEINNDERKIKFNKLNNAFKNEIILKMRPFIKSEDVSELIKHNIIIKKEISKKYNNTFIDEVPLEVINSILPLSLKGNPLFIIELTQALLNQNFLALKNRSSLMLTEEFKKMLKLRDYSKLQIPFMIEKILGNIIDSLDCSDIILLKNASIIGNIFDIDKLADILNMSVSNYDDLIASMKKFESYGIVEILFDLRKKHFVAMFAIPLMREILYQRMLTIQKTELHSKIARKLEFSKFSYMGKNLEHDILKKHLETSEQTFMDKINEIDNEKIEKDIYKGNIINQKILVTKDIIEKLKIIDLKISSSYSLIKKQFMPMLMSAHIIKKDEHGGKVEERFAVLTNQKFCYYYDESNYNDNKEPLASFFYKNIYEINKLNKEYYDNKNAYYMEIKVSSWYKKSELKVDRNFIIGFEQQEEMNKWEIALDFLRVKNLYDEFTANFGLIQLPINNQMELYKDKNYKRRLNITKECIYYWKYF